MVAKNEAFAHPPKLWRCASSSGTVRAAGMVRHRSAGVWSSWAAFRIFQELGLFGPREPSIIFCEGLPVN